MVAEISRSPLVGLPCVALCSLFLAFFTPSHHGNPVLCTMTSPSSGDPTASGNRTASPFFFISPRWVSLGRESFFVMIKLSIANLMQRPWHKLCGGHWQGHDSPESRIGRGNSVFGILWFVATSVSVPENGLVHELFLTVTENNFRITTTGRGWINWIGQAAYLYSFSQ